MGFSFERHAAGGGYVLWDRLHAARLPLSRQANMHLLQGGSLAQLFGDVRILQDGLCVTGPLLLLRWRTDALWAGAGYLEEVTMARVLSSPEGLPLMAMAAALLPRA